LLQNIRRTSNGIQIYGAIANNRDFVLILVIAVIILSICIALIVAKSISDPIQMLQKGTAVIGQRVTRVLPSVKDLGLWDVIQRVWKTGKPVYISGGVYPRT
jgi:hypothetical protein